MSVSASAMPGGQPSTTQPIAGPWLSPKEVTQKSFPKVFPDIAQVPFVHQNSIKFNDKFNIPLFTDGATRCQINPIPEN
jgi:hypothetical protein